MLLRSRKRGFEPYSTQEESARLCISRQGFEPHLHTGMPKKVVPIQDFLYISTFHSSTPLGLEPRSCFQASSFCVGLDGRNLTYVAQHYPVSGTR